MSGGECRCNAQITFRYVQVSNTEFLAWPSWAILEARFHLDVWFECEESEAIDWSASSIARWVPISYFRLIPARNVVHSVAWRRGIFDERSRHCDRIVTENSSVGCRWNARSNWFVLRNRRSAGLTGISRRHDGRPARNISLLALLTH